MYCVNCGKEISDKAAVCVGCGVPVKDADRRSQITAGLLALLLGGWGAHKFYHGHFIIGILYALSALLGWGTIGVLSVAAGDSPSQRVTFVCMVLFCLLFFLSFSCVVEGIIYFVMKKSAYDERYNKKTPDERTNGKFNRETAPIASLIIVGLCLLLFPANYALRGSSSLGAVKIFMALGADVNAKDNYGYTPLTEAIIDGHLDIVKYLIDRGADVNVKNNDGDTPIDIVVNNRHLDIVKYLIAHGADVNAKDKYGYTPLTKAVLNGHLDLVKYLIDHRADVNAKDNDGFTPLIWAARNRHLDTVKYLIARGADVNAKNNHGDTPLSWAAYQGHLDTVKYLIDRGANVNVKSNHGGTPLDLAKTDEIKKILRDAGGKSGKDL